MQQRLEQTKNILVITAIALIAVVVSARGNTGPSLAAADPAATYKSKCASCHGPDGSGQTAAGKALKLKDLRSAEVQGMGDANLYDVIAKGKGKMPAYEKALGGDTCKALVAYIRQLGGK